jgi:hypothetical protein
MGKAAALPVTGTGTVRAGPGVYRGARIRDTSGVANTVKIFDNTAASGTILFTAQLAAQGTTTDAPADGIYHANGLHLTSTGAIEGSIWV